MRLYLVNEPTFNLSATILVDLLQIKGATNKILRVRKFWVRSATLSGVLPSAQYLTVRARYLPATVTDGSGGGTPTIVPADVGDAAATFTALSRNTTKATTSGTAKVLAHEGGHIYSGADMQFTDPPLVVEATSIVFELINTAIVGSSIDLTVGAEVTEEG